MRILSFVVMVFVVLVGTATSMDASANVSNNWGWTGTLSFTGDSQMFNLGQLAEGTRIHLCLSGPSDATFDLDIYLYQIVLGFVDQPNTPVGEMVTFSNDWNTSAESIDFVVDVPNGTYFIVVESWEQPDGALAQFNLALCSAPNLGGGGKDLSKFRS